MRAGEYVRIVYNDSRGSEVLDTYMDGYEGGVITDGYRLYERYDKGGKHQRCFAHEIR